MKKFAKLFLVATLVLGLSVVFLACKEDENPTDPGPVGGITSAAFPGNAATLAPGGAPAVGALTGGTPPYSVNTAPNAAVATAVLSGANNDTLTITPVGEGTTSVVIEDSAPSSGDSPAGATVTINITVSTGGGGGTGIGGSGTFSVASSRGSLNASGTFDINATSGQGVGGYRYTAASAEVMEVWGYVARSTTDFDIAIALMSYPNGTLMTGTYPFIPTGSGMYGYFGLALGVNPQNIQDNLYVAAMGTGINLTSITATNAAGNGSGSGYKANDPTQTFTFEGKTFNVTNYGTSAPPEGPIGTAIEKAFQELRRVTKQK